jgi:hypothetical protein
VSTPRRTRRIASCAALVSIAVSLALPALSSAIAVGSAGRPRVATGGVGHVRGSSGLLQGTVNPRGLETTYYFQYGLTTAYGLQTAAAPAGKGILTVKVGQTLTNLKAGVHYRLVAVNADGTSVGKDRTFTGAKTRVKFNMVTSRTEPPTPYGGTYLLRGALAGAGNAGRAIAVQSSAYPFLSPFLEFGAPLATNAAGAFVVQAKNLTQTTQFRVVTRDPRPVIGPTVTAHVSVKVSLKVRSSSHKGLVRLYGTVTPARVGAKVVFQLEEPARPRGNSEKEVRYAGQGSTVVKRGTRTVSRFSQILTVRKTGRYRAFVIQRAGPLESGSSTSLTLHAAPGSTKRK